MRRIFLVAAAAVAAAAAAVAADAQMLQAVVNAKAPVAVGNTITFATLANGAPVNSTAAGSGAYTGTTPTSITAIWNASCSGSSTVSAFSASGGHWTATFSTPSAVCSGTLTVTDNLGQGDTSPNVAVGYQGAGDVASSWQTWFGLRAFSSAVAVTGTTVALNIKRLSDNHTCDVLIATTGGLGNTTNCSTGTDNGQAVSSFQTVDAVATASITGSTLNATGGHLYDSVTGAGVVPGTIIISGSSGAWTVNTSQTVPSTTVTLKYGLRVPTLYDQANVGGTHNWTQAALANQAILALGCYTAGTEPCLVTGIGGVTNYVSSGLTFTNATTADFYGSMIAFSEQSEGDSKIFERGPDTGSWDFMLLIHNSNFPSTQIAYPTVYTVTGVLNTVESATTYTPGACYGFAGSYDGSNQRLYMNGAQDPASPVAAIGTLRGSGTSWTFGGGSNVGNPIGAFISEGGVASVAFTGAVQSALYSNQNTFWGC